MRGIAKGYCRFMPGDRSDLRREKKVSKTFYAVPTTNGHGYLFYESRNQHTNWYYLVSWVRSGPGFGEPSVPRGADFAEQADRYNDQANPTDSLILPRCLNSRWTTKACAAAASPDHPFVLVVQSQQAGYFLRFDHVEQSLAECKKRLSASATGLLMGTGN